MKPISSVLAAALLVLALPSQGDATKQMPPGLDKLVAEWKAANTAHRAALAEIQASEAYKAAREAKDNTKLRELTGGVKRPDAKAFGERALALADQLAGDDGLAVLTFTAKNLYDKDVFAGLLERVEKNYIGSAGLDGILENAMALSQLAGPEQTAGLLERVATDNKHAQPRAWAMYWQSVLLTRNKSASDEDKARAEKLLADAEKLAAGTILGDRIGGPRFEKERLQIGMVAPDIEGVDTEGVAFKLSDYRGKVVVLDFWGFW